eukprot:4744702-Prymnesium_polylepis.1
MAAGAKVVVARVAAAQTAVELQVESWAARVAANAAVVRQVVAGTAEAAMEEEWTDVREAEMEAMEVEDAGVGRGAAHSASTAPES